VISSVAFEIEPGVVDVDVEIVDIIMLEGVVLLFL